MHWARSYVGKPWAPDAMGPARFSCWGLMRDTFRRVDGVDLPALIVGSGQPIAENVGALMRAARAAGLRPVDGCTPLDGDIVLMRGAGVLHCGRVVVERGRVKVLHSGLDRGVSCDSWGEVTMGVSIELWRRAT